MKKKDNTQTDKSMERKEVRRCQAGVGTGLTKEQVQEYTEAGWTNAAVDSPSKTVPEIIRGNLFTYFNLVFAVLAVLVILAGSFRSLTFLPVVLANLMIGIVQEIRAKRILDKLSMLHAPKAVVVRDGIRQEVSAGELVLDDIVLFQAGNQICADAVVLEGEVSVNESLLTGESDEVPKRPGDILMSGSFVASGSCCARLEKVGEDSYISRLTLEAKAMKAGEQSEMLRILDRLVGVVGIFIIPVGIALFAQHFLFLELPFGESIVSMVAAVVGMIPEGLYLLASVALVVSVMRLASKRVLVHDMKCIETLARVDVLCVDKTGTITENTMEVSGVVPITATMGNPGGMAMPGMRSLLSDFVAAMPDDNATMKALKRYFNMPPVRKAEAVVPFSSVYKYSGAVFDGESYVLGAPEFVLREEYEIFREQIEGYGSDGYRVLLFGRYEGETEGKQLTGQVTPLCIVLLLNPIRKQAYETFRYFSEQGVEIKVISGDNPVTVSQAALRAGIAGAEKCVDASIFTTSEELWEASEEYTVFGRVTPEQKRELVRTLKSRGHTVVCVVIPPLYHKTAVGGETAHNDRGGQQERVRSIDDNMDALLWRLRLIEEAQESVILCTFDFRDDDSGRDMMAALFHAAERGVDVRIMVDGINGMLYLTGSRNFRELAEHENVQVKLYNPVNLLVPGRVNYRMHDKYLIADDFAYILGGRNTNNLFLGDYSDSYNEDRDILVYETAAGEGKSYLQLQEYFEEIWNLPCAKSYEMTAYRKGALEEHYEELKRKYPQVFEEFDWKKETVETKGIELCTNPMEPKNKQPLLWDRLFAELSQGEDILIQTPYIICSRDMYRDLTDLSPCGVEVITNAVESGANPFGCTDYLNQKKRIYRTGVHVYEYLGTQALHTKTMLMGERVSIVGSCNLDMRSIYLDTEMMLIIESEELNGLLRNQAEELKMQSRHVYPDGTAVDGVKYNPLEQGVWKKCFYGVLRVLVIPIRHLL